jgi:hypothetical protein
VQRYISPFWAVGGNWKALSHKVDSGREDPDMESEFSRRSDELIADARLAEARKMLETG